ncbi:pentatricopeptide repeat domain-containing protein [Ophiostoma piceae UAMH 11346]|uniref:Pentatricopeptide repeat domain-containing protein n=1 Tax=Ophiostoma piceae (strain UAMH 11346) TaxID=1262450 RepID=S3C9E2_OPHP1|nr:pentatricopeptide repeat domain-containing protein [Ophiostoma piceae UAMH 11346]
MRGRPRPSAPPVEWAMRLASSRVGSAQRLSLAPASACPRSYCGHCGLRVKPEAPERAFSSAAGLPSENYSTRLRTRRPPSRQYSTFISNILPGQHRDDSARHRSESSTSRSGSIPDSHVLGHLRRRGPFLPAIKSGDSALQPGEAPLQPRPAKHHHDKLVLSADHYGKWSKLLFDYDQLMFEAGLSTESSHQRPHARRSVDSPEHAADISLWSAIFNFAQRRGGTKDALIVWQEIFQLKQLYQVGGTVARVFWESVLAAALENELFLESTWAYAEWMQDTHGVVWPKYYESIVTHFLDAGDYERALRWHVRLSPHFSIPKRNFFAMLKGFLLDGGADAELHQTLQHIYATSRHRSLYDTVVPLLWSQGNSAMARAWRDTLVANGDLPSSTASRPFLQFLHGYYPETTLYPQEETIMHSRLDTSAETDGASRGTRAGLTPAPGSHTNLFHFMNQVHGETFGIKEKKVFDDKMGSKWFATKFVSLDTAINFLYTLGISEIGPLSLQSIALREGTPAGVLHRLEQLEQSQISIGKSSYSTAIRHLAQTGDAETLLELLQSMIEPEVFDNIVLQRQVMGMASFKGDWKTYRMILVVRVATSDASIGTSSNRVLLTCLERGKKALVLKLLDEFAAREYEIFPSTCQEINRHILRNTMPVFDKNNPPDVDFYAALCRRMAAMRLPVATQAWRNILYILGRNGRLYKTENTALSIVRSYIGLQKRGVGRPMAAAAAATIQPAPDTLAMPSVALSDETSAFKVYVGDVPTIFKGEEKPLEGDIGYRLLPRDLPRNHPLHPLSLVFEEKLIRSLVRWYFHRMGSYRQGKLPPLKLPKPSPPGISESPQSLDLTESTGAPQIPQEPTAEQHASTNTPSITSAALTGSRPEQSPVDASNNGVAKTKPRKPKKQRLTIPPKDPVNYSFAAGIRLIAMLRDRGVDVSVENVRSETLLCILAVFGPDSTVSRVWKPARAMNQATISEVKILCDAAWSDSTTGKPATAVAAETLLPPVSVIEAALEALVPVSSDFTSQISKPGAKSDWRQESQDVFFNAVRQPAGYHEDSHGA